MSPLTEEEARAKIEAHTLAMSKDIMQAVTQGIKDHLPANSETDVASYMAGVEIGLHMALGTDPIRTLRFALIFDLGTHGGNTIAHDVAEDLAKIMDTLIARGQNTEDAAESRALLEALHPDLDEKEQPDA